MQKGTVVHKVWWFNPERKVIEPDSVSGELKYIYKDSFAVATVLRTQFDEVNNVRHVSFPVHKYVLIDMRQKTFYDFLNFSDTAQPVKVHNVDSLGRVEDGWKMFMNDTFMYTGSMIRLPDTTLNGTRFSRLKGYRLQQGPDGTASVGSIVAYYSCEKKGLPLQIDHGLGNRLGCPVLRMDFVRNGYFRYSEYRYAEDSLSKMEEAVLDAWIRHVRSGRQSRSGQSSR
ncbi:hypothetical protein GCM10023184_23440 [Flaviaesturariibacter amylovorans]|uniref:Uncharacterized protein n=1 Tax=Flaviaesturariibacter amylovorans TaxID=1084520 RepID=A0ABP8GXW0_9BACT